MKQLLLLSATLLLALSCSQSKAPKTLVLYYSQTTNTETVAKEIASRLGADLQAIVPVTPYDGDFQATIERCLKEREDSTLCLIYPPAAHVRDYDVIFLGYPVWFGTYAPPVDHFILNEDFSGKKIVPFCTFGSGGLESSVADLKAALEAAHQSDVEILPGYGVRAARMEAMPKEVEQFLIAGGFLEGEYTPLADFPELHEVSDDEAAIFDAAVDGYPMLHAQAKCVATRALPNGTEYHYIAEDLPREDKPDMPPAGELDVYVTVTNGAAPVFTRVVR